jgi:hypothetical protein
MSASLQWFPDEILSDLFITRAVRRCSNTSCCAPGTGRTCSTSQGDVGQIGNLPYKDTPELIAQKRSRAG